MPVLTLHQFTATKATAASDFHPLLDRARQAVHKANQHDGPKTQHSTIAIVQKPDNNSFELWAESTSDTTVAPQDLALIQTLKTIFTSHATYTTYRIAIPTSSFDPSNNPFTSNLIETVQNIFPAAQATPAFRQRIESEFRRFDDAYMPGVSGTTGLIVGWTEEAQEIAELNGAPATCMFVVRGWNSQEEFDRSVQSEHAQKAFPIVFGWNAPYRLVSCPFLYFLLFDRGYMTLTRSLLVDRCSWRCLNADARMPMWSGGK